MEKTLSKRTLRSRLGFTTDAEVARFFRISASAVSQWADDDPLPELRQLQVERKRPDIFDATGACLDEEDGDGISDATSCVESAHGRETEVAAGGEIVHVANAPAMVRSAA